MGSVYPRDFILCSNEVVAFCWGTCWGLGVGERGREVSLCCWKAPFTSEDATGRHRRVRILGTACQDGVSGVRILGSAPWDRGGRRVRIAEIAKKAKLRILFC